MSTEKRIAELEKELEELRSKREAEIEEEGKPEEAAPVKEEIEAIVDGTRPAPRSIR